MEAFTVLVEKFGLIGGVIGSMAWFIYYLMDLMTDIRKDHNKERSEWKQTIETIHERSTSNYESNLRMVNELISFIKDLKK